MSDEEKTEWSNVKSLHKDRFLDSKQTTFDLDKLHPEARRRLQMLGFLTIDDNGEQQELTGEEIDAILMKRRRPEEPDIIADKYMMRHGLYDLFKVLEENYSWRQPDRFMLFSDADHENGARSTSGSCWFHDQWFRKTLERQRQAVIWLTTNLNTSLPSTLEVFPSNRMNKFTNTICCSSTIRSAGPFKLFGSFISKMSEVITAYGTFRRKKAPIMTIPRDIHEPDSPSSTIDIMVGNNPALLEALIYSRPWDSRVLVTMAVSCPCLTFAWTDLRRVYCRRYHTYGSAHGGLVTDTSLDRIETVECEQSSIESRERSREHDIWHRDRNWLDRFVLSRPWCHHIWHVISTTLNWVRVRDRFDCEIGQSDTCPSRRRKAEKPLSEEPCAWDGWFRSVEWWFQHRWIPIGANGEVKLEVVIAQWAENVN